MATSKQATDTTKWVLATWLGTRSRLVDEMIGHNDLGGLQQVIILTMYLRYVCA
jgi:hypothetical protein